MRSWTYVCLVGFCLAGCSAPPPIVVDPAQAMAVGNAFLKAIMRGDYRGAYDQYISPGIKFAPQSRFEQFSADWGAIKEKYGAFRRARLEAYQLLPGKRVVQLYYDVAQAKAGTVEYHLVVECSPAGRATIFLMDIGNQVQYPNPAGSREPKVAPARPKIITPDK